MHTEVVHHNKAAPPPTLPLEFFNEGEECVVVIVAFEDMGVDDPPLLTDGADHTNG